MSICVNVTVVEMYHVSEERAALFSTLKMEAVSSSETLVNFY
jgi:hypothetical protein